jgi:Right handed beta helix region/Domain of unknown function DUF11
MNRLALPVLLLALATSAHATDLRFATIFSPGGVNFFDPSSAVTYDIAVSISGSDPAQSVVFTMPLPPGGSFLGTHQGATTFTCDANAGTVTCRAPQISNFQSVLFDVSAPPTGGQYVTHAILSSATPDTDTSNNAIDITLNVYQPFVVTTTADTGPGSLRQAIVDVNAACGSANGPKCKVLFDLGATSAAIEPRTPLPDITACGTVIDGGEVSPRATAPRRVSLSGAFVTKGSGLTIRSACPDQQDGVTVQYLAIYGFPENGISLTTDVSGAAIPSKTGHQILNDVIGMDASGAIARPNGLRGVGSTANAGINIAACNISNNLRSGVFLWTGTGGSITGCRIDDNGASGIFTHMSRLSIEVNEVARNHEFGIAIAREARLVLVPNNVLQGNGGIGIDRGLDGPTLTGDPQVPNAPVITSAQYDAATNTTIITVRDDLSADQKVTFGSFVNLLIYANTTRDGAGRAEAERLIAVGQIGAGGSVALSVPGDLRGQIITAQANIFHFGDEALGEATELSDGVVVQ